MIPVFLLLLAGVLDFGFLLYSRMTVINAAREGARAAVTAADPRDIPADAKQAAKSAASGLNAADLDVPDPICIPDTGTCNFTSTPPAATAAGTGDSVKVRVNYTYHTFFPLLFGATIDLGSSVQMALE